MSRLHRLTGPRLGALLVVAAVSLLVACGTKSSDATSGQPPEPIAACETLIARSRVCVANVAPTTGVTARDLEQDMRTAIYAELARSPDTRAELRAKCEANLAVLRAQCP